MCYSTENIINSPCDRGRADKRNYRREGLMAFKKERLLKVCYRSEARQSRSGFRSWASIPVLRPKWNARKGSW